MLEKEIVEILSKRYGISARLRPAGFGRRAFTTVMTYVEDGQSRTIIVRRLRTNDNQTFVKFETDSLYEHSCFKSGDVIVVHDGGFSRGILSQIYWRAHVDFQSMTWEDLKNWKLKDGEYEELLALVSNKPKFWFIEKIKSLFSSK